MSMPSGETARRREALQARWQKLRADYPGVELAYKDTRDGRMTRGRLGPESTWTGWRLSRRAVLGELEQAPGELLAVAAGNGPVAR
jgi:hypothetical protein